MQRRGSAYFQRKLLVDMTVRHQSEADPTSVVEPRTPRAYKQTVELGEMDDRVLITVQSPTYFSQNDETAMFEWLGRIDVVSDVTGEGHNLTLRLKRTPTDDQLRDLLALFYRYGMDMKPLAALRTAKNESWFSDRSNYWYGSVFGNA